jgi:NADH-quinone oxidoreductase subunit E
MSVRRLAEKQPESFAFLPENEERCEEILKKYPEGREASAVIALLWLAQKQNNYWLPRPAIERVAQKLGMPFIRVLEIATFYTMFNLAPVGRFHVQMCGTTPCLLAGSDAIKKILLKRIGGQLLVTADGAFSWVEVECLGACCNAPMVQINEDYFEDLTPENFEKLLDDLSAGRPVTIGSQQGRVTSEPAGSLTSLTSLYGTNGHTGPLSVPHEPTVVNEAKTLLEFQAQDVPPAEPALERVRQENEKSSGTPGSSIVEAGSQRTSIAVSEPGKLAEAEAQSAAARAGGSHQGGPSNLPGIEPSGSAPENPDKTSA